MGLSRQAPLTALILAVLLVLAVLLAGCGASSPGQPSSARASAAGSGSPTARPAAPAGSATPRSRAAAPPVSLPVAPGAGARPQTRAFPSTTSAAFRNAMADLWLAVTTGNPRFGLPAFFPVAAYKQVKAIPYPAADWQDRLWYDFTLDVGAAHRLLGRGARLVRVIAPADRRGLGLPGCLLQLDRLLAPPRCPRGVPGARSGTVVRHRLADLLAGRVVRGPPRCRDAQRGDRNRLSARRRPGRPGTAGRLLSRSPIHALTGPHGIADATRPIKCA